MVILLLAYIFSAAFSCLLGVYDAILYGRQAADSFRWNEHVILVLIRGSFPAALLLGTFMDLPQIIITTVGLVMMYSFFHNGSYYVTRAAIDCKAYAWRAWTGYSQTDTSLVHFRYWPRTILFLISLIILIWHSI